MKYLYIDPPSKIIEYSNNAYTIYCLSPDVLSERQNKGYDRINEVGVSILTLVDGTNTYEKIVSALMEQYDDTYTSVSPKVETFFENLKKHGYYIKEQTTPILREISKIKHNNIYPTVVSLEITNRCNIKCRHCYGSYENTNERDITIDSARFLFEASVRMGVEIIELTGGDPSVHSNCSEIIESAILAGIKKIMLLTNGVSIGDELYNTIVNYKDRVYLQIDLHSLNEDYYDWFTNSRGNLSKVKSNIVNLINSGVRVRVCSIITPGNVDEFYKIGEWAIKHNAIEFAPSAVLALGRANNEEDQKELFLHDNSTLKKFIEEQKRFSDKYPGFIKGVLEVEELTRKNCGALTSNIGIDSEGNIKLCSLDTGEYFDLRLGNAFENDIKKLYDENKEFFSKLMNLEPPMHNSAECENCEKKYFCSNCILRGLIGAEQVPDCKWRNKLDTTMRDYFGIKIT